MERWREELYQNSLMHYGVKGMQKGVRRFQNTDGSLTAAGKLRYLDPNTARQLRAQVVSRLQMLPSPALSTNRVVVSTRQRESLEGGDRSRRIAAINRRGHTQRVQDMVEEKQEERPDPAEETPQEKKTQKSSSATNKVTSTSSNQQRKKELARLASGLAEGAAAGVKPIMDKREAERQRLLERAEREREARRKGLTANPQSKTKKKKTVEEFKKKGERYVAKKTR